MPGCLKPVLWLVCIVAAFTSIIMHWTNNLAAEKLAAEIRAAKIDGAARTGRTTAILQSYATYSRDQIAAYLLALADDVVAPCKRAVGYGGRHQPYLTSTEEVFEVLKRRVATVAASDALLAHAMMAMQSCCDEQPDCAHLHARAEEALKIRGPGSQVSPR